MKVLKYIVALFVLFESCSKNEPVTNTIPDPPTTNPSKDTLTVGWSKVKIPGVALTDIVFIDNNTGFIAGSKGLYKSVDGGNTWQLSSTRFAGDCYLAATSDSKVFVILADTDTLYRSFDGGVTFSAIKMNAPAPLLDLYFANTDTGYIPGGKNTLFRTTDGGHTWKTVTPLSGFDLGAGHYLPFFTDGTTGWVSDGHTIYHTKGSANLWEPSLDFPLQEPGISSNNYITISAADAKVVFAAVSTNAKISVYKSIDGGIHFTLAGEVVSYHQSYADIHFITANMGYLCNNKSIFVTSDGGATWKSVVSLVSAEIAEIHFTDSDHGWACCFDGTVLIFKK